MAAGAKLADRGHEVRHSYIGPVWLTRLLGTNETSLPLQGVGSLDLSKKTTNDELRSIASELAKLKHLHSLGYYGDEVTDDGLKFIVERGTTSSIEFLYLTGTRVNGSAFESPEAWPRLIYVSAFMSELNDEGFARLAQIPSISSLHVDYSKVTRRSIAYAQRMPNLTTLRAEWTDITPEDCVPLTLRGVECVVTTREP